MRIDMEFARRDDCLDLMVPSDLRGLIGERDEALERVDSLSGLYRMHKETESRETIELKQKVDDLSMLVRQLVQALRKAAPDHALPVKAMDYLKRKGLQGNPMRDD